MFDNKRHCLITVLISCLVVWGSWKAYARTQNAPETERFSITIEIRATDCLYHIHRNPYGGTDETRRATTFSIYPAHYERVMNTLKEMGYDVRPVKIRGIPPGIGDFEGEVNGMGGLSDGLRNGKYFTVVSDDVFFERLIIDAKEKTFEIHYEKSQHPGQPKYGHRSRGKEVAEQLTHALLFP